MLPFLAMLQGAGGAAGAAGGAGGASRLGQMLGQKGVASAQGSNKNIGMQYANMGLNPPEVPNMMAMLNGMQGMTGQRQRAPLQVYDILHMLQGG